MSHTPPVALPPTGQVYQFTIQNYTTGGELVQSSEIATIASIQAVIFGQVPPGQNSLGVTLWPLLSGGKVQLFQFSGGTFVQVPTTTALNAVINAYIVVG